MKLGNTGGKNKGKKYIKITGQEIVTERNKTKANEFNAWFAFNAKSLQQQLFSKYSHPLNVDVFIDTYIKIYDRILYGGLDIADNASYFCRAFYTNYIQQRTSQSKFVFSDINQINDISDDTSEKEENEQKEKNLFSQIESHIKENHLEDAELFEKWSAMVMTSEKKQALQLK